MVLYKDFYNKQRTGVVNISKLKCDLLPVKLVLVVVVAVNRAEAAVTEML